MKALVIIAVVIAIIGIAIYQFGFQKMGVEPGSVSREEMIKGCKDAFLKDPKISAAQASQMETVCECMMDASATALNNKDGVTVIDWMTEVQKNSAACMAKAGTSTQ